MKFENAEGEGPPDYSGNVGEDNARISVPVSFSPTYSSSERVFHRARYSSKVSSK